MRSHLCLYELSEKLSRILGECHHSTTLQNQDQISHRLARQETFRGIWHSLSKLKIESQSLAV